MSLIQVTIYKSNGKAPRQERAVRTWDIPVDSIDFFFGDSDQNNSQGTVIELKSGRTMQVREAPATIRALLTTPAGGCGCLSDFGAGAYIIWNGLSEPCADGAYILMRRTDGPDDGHLVVRKRVSGAWDDENETVLHFQ